MSKIRWASIFALLPVAAAAQESYVCTQGDLTRRVEIVYETGVTVPCEVHYHKDTEAPGEQQVLWRALNEEGYCEARAAEFVAKLGGWGWQCDAAAAPAAEPMAEPMADEPDDTSDLAPAEEPASDPR